MSDGYTTDIRLDRADERIVIAYAQDCEAIIDDNKYWQTEPQKSKDMRRIASIPAVWAMKWLNEEWERGNIGLRMGTKEFTQLLFRKIQDPDYKWMRTDCPNLSIGWK